MAIMYFQNQVKNSMIPCLLQKKDLLQQKERLLSDVSHELRTPLSKIRLLIDLLKPKEKSTLLASDMQKAGVDEETISKTKKIFYETNEKLNKIDKNILYLDSIITNILLSDQMSSPYTNLKIESSAISMLIKQASEPVSYTHLRAHET